MMSAEESPGTVLSKINSPADLKNLTVAEMKQLATEIREYLVDVVSVNGGHFGASLGVVELTIALHYVFNTPYDRIVWDVGHQAYTHKILTGRRESFNTLRQFKGISGFPRMSESKYDAFGVGHASTSISAALGMAEASKLMGITDRQHIAVIGDGSLTGGQAFEGINNAGVSNSNLLVILNDNSISIDANVGAVKEYLVQATTSSAYNKFKEDLWYMLGKVSKYGPNAQQIASSIARSTKSFIFKQSNMFEALNFRYFGPVDGHNIEKLIRILNDLKNINGPKVLHIRTIKGKGYKPAEENQTQFHAPGLFDKKTGKILVSDNTDEPLKYQEVFGKTLVELAELNERVVGITAAMSTGTSMTYMFDAFPQRTFDVGIAEQHAVTFAAGLAAEGMKPFCAIYSSFLQRSYDQIIHDVALQKLPVVFCIDRAGLVGEDGATHHGTFDISYLRNIPGLILCAPMNEHELRNMMFTAMNYVDGPFAIRFPRAKGVLKNWELPLEKLDIGTGQLIRNGDDLAILSIGHVGNNVIEASKVLEAENIEVAHYNMRFIRPLDEKLLTYIFKKFKNIITVEDGVKIGGFGSAVIEYMNRNDIKANIITLGIPDHFIEHGSISELQNICGFGAKNIVSEVRKLLTYKSEAY
jgi:1-deoxy-D-xylulose-5-phosphate synthase